MTRFQNITALLAVAALLVQAGAAFAHWNCACCARHAAGFEARSVPVEMAARAAHACCEQKQKEDAADAEAVGTALGDPLPAKHECRCEFGPAPRGPLPENQRLAVVPQQDALHAAWVYCPGHTSVAAPLSAHEHGFSAVLSSSGRYLSACVFRC